MKKNITPIIFYKNLNNLIFGYLTLKLIKKLNKCFTYLIKKKIKKFSFFLSIFFISKLWTNLIINFYSFISHPFIWYFKYLINYKLYDNNYKLIIKLKKTRLYINLINYINKNYLHLSLGMFLKYFEYKKSLKKKKLLKYLLIKYLRKFILIVKLKNFNFFFKSSVYFLTEFFSILFKPLKKKFFNPLTSKLMADDKQKKANFSVFFIYFLNTVNFSFLKTRKKGRIKRKILRKLVKLNNLID